MYSDISLWLWFWFSLMATNAEHLFMCIFATFLYILFSEMSTHVFYPSSSRIVWVWGFLLLLLLFFLLSFESTLHILDACALLDAWFANTFSQSLFCVFNLLTESFIEQTFFNTDGLLIFFTFMDHAFGVKV